MAAQGLDRRPFRRRPTKADILATIRAIEYVQLDTISVISRSHETVLWSRLGPYDPGLIADWAAFMLSPAADFLCGSVVYVDGGTDAYFRSDSWPASSPLWAIPRFLRGPARLGT